MRFAAHATAAHPQPHLLFMKLCPASFHCIIQPYPWSSVFLTAGSWRGGGGGTAHFTAAGGGDANVQRYTCARRTLRHRKTLHPFDVSKFVALRKNATLRRLSVLNTHSCSYLSLLKIRAITVFHGQYSNITTTECAIQG